MIKISLLLYQKINTFKKTYRFWKLVNCINNSNYKNIYIISAAGYNNIGDDLMLLFTKKIFKNKNIKFITDKINSNKIVSNNIKKIGVKTLSKIPKHNNNTLVLIGGGTLFNPNTFTDEIYLNYAYDLILRGHEVGFWGVEITNFIDINKAKAVLEKLVFITVRNRESKNIILNINKNVIKKIIIIGDLIEHFPIKSFFKKKEKMVGICISPKSKITIKKILNFINEYQKQGYHVELFSFCNHPFSDEEKDSLYFNQIQKQNSQISIYSTNDLNNIFNRIKHYNFIITTRLHVTIIASKLHIKTINVSNETKCINYCVAHNITHTKIK